MTTTTETFVPAYTCSSCRVHNMVEIKNGDGQRVCFKCGTPADSLIITSKVNLLTVADRCDRCRAQAYGRVTMKESGFELLLCGHHLRTSLEKNVIQQQAAKIEDFRPSIT